MDHRLQIENELRPNVLDGMADIPLYSIAWRYLKGMYAQREKTDQARKGAAEARQKSLGRLAQEVFALKRQAQSEAPALLPLSERMQVLLEELDTHIVAPDGEVYGDDLMEILDNLVPQPDPALTQPVVKETITPTIFCEGELVQRGKAVIGVPELKLPPVDDHQRMRLGKAENE
jgi:hypothetical protein